MHKNPCPMTMWSGDFAIEMVVCNYRVGDKMMDEKSRE